MTGSTRYESCSTFYLSLSPPRNYIDEAMIPYKGHRGFKQYMKDKPTKWGMKLVRLETATYIGFRFTWVRSVVQDCTGLSNQVFI